MRALHKIFQQTSWQLVGKVVSTGTTVVIFSMLSRSYGESSVGVLTLSLTFLAFLSLAVDFGLNAHFLKHFQGENFSEIWNRLLGLRLVIAGVGTLIGLIILAVWPQQQFEFKLTVLFGLVVVFQSIVLDSTAAIFQSKLRYDLAVIANTVGTLVTFGIVLHLIQIKASVPELMIGYDLGWIVAAVVAVMLARPFVDRIRPVFDWAFFGKTIKEIWPIALTLVFNVVYFRIDSFLLSLYWGFSEVGIYNLAYSVFQSALVVPTFIMNSYYPIMLESLACDVAKFRKQVWLATAGMVGVGLLGTVATFFLSPLVINLLAGENGFVGSSAVLQILSLSFPAFFGTSIAMWTLFSLGKYKIILWIYLVGLIANAGLNFSLIPHFGFTAAAINTVVCEYLILLMQLVMIIKVFKSHESNH